MITKEEGILQRPISLHSWKMIAASKGYCKTIKRIEEREPIEVIQEYLKTEYFNNVDKLSYSDLFSILVDVINEVCCEVQIHHILKYDILQYFINKEIKQLIKHPNLPLGPRSLSEEDLCQLLISNLASLQIRKNVNGKIIDSFVIQNEDGTIMSIDEAEDKWLRGHQKVRGD